MSDVYSTEEIARSVAEELSAGLADWSAYHPIVKATVEWLDEHNFLVIVAEEPTGDDAGGGAMSDLCPCGATDRVESVKPDFTGWLGQCDAGHNVFLTDLESTPVILEETHELA